MRVFEAGEELTRLRTEHALGITDLPAKTDEVLIGGVPGQRLDPARVGSNRSLGNEHQRSNLTRRVDVGSTTELRRISARLHDTDLVTVLVTEEREPRPSSRPRPYSSRWS